MEGLAKIASPEEWYKNDDEYRHLYDQSALYAQKHKATRNHVALKQQQEKTTGAQIGAATGGLGGSLLARKVKLKYPFVGGLAGSIGGGITGSKIADMTFEDRHKTMVANEAQDQFKKDFSRHRLFGYMDQKGYDME
jgi:uncharacterized protein YcfJ